jgi:hypothetical protein
MDARLTDPYEDPESNYLDPAVWERLPRWVQRVLLFNNTLLGRMAIGPLVGQIAFMADGLAADPRGRPGGAARLALAPAGGGRHRCDRDRRRRCRSGPMRSPPIWACRS